MICSPDVFEFSLKLNVVEHLKLSELISSISGLNKLNISRKVFFFSFNSKVQVTAVSYDCLREMKLPLLAAFNTLCILGSNLNYLQKLVLSITNKWDNPAHKSS